MIAALYIDPRGPYPKIADVDCWDEVRDAKTYAGPWPVVAHPPCGPWGRLRHLSHHDDPACALRAVEQVRAYGGVLEHPWGSKLWEACALPRPGEPADAWGGRTIEITQVEWGHVARKRTWLYLVRVPESAIESPPFPGREPTHWISGGRGREGKKRTTTPVPPGIKVASRQQARRTPPLLAAYLVRLATSAELRTPTPRA